MRSAGGFTLMEVLVALAVLALAMGAAVKVSGEQAAGLTHLRDKTAAHWVAMNRAVELRAGAASGTLRRNGTEEQLGWQWHWQLRQLATPVPEMQRVEVEVRRDPDDERPLVRRSFYLAIQPAASEDES